MVRIKTLLGGVALASLLWPGLGLAHPPPGRTPGGEFARGVFAPILSAVYFPVKLGVGVGGAVLGGVSGFLTGGSERAAEGIWHPTVGGTYFITPAILDGGQPFLPFDYGATPPSQSQPSVASPGAMPPR
jgi:hypothetical protein